MRPPLLLALLLTAAPLAALAQSPLPARTPASRCRIVPDSVRGPTPGQIAERQRLREQLLRVAQRHQVTEPRGLLLVDVDSTRRGQLLFLESNYPEAAVREATREVERYLESLPGGRGYQALVRVDGEYPAMAPGKEHCPPAMLNGNERLQWLNDTQRRHPDAGRLPAPVDRSAVILLVVSREGNVVLSALASSSGDAFLDEEAAAMGRRMRFVPAQLDGVPFDTRIRFPVNFTIE